MGFQKPLVSGLGRWLSQRSVCCIHKDVSPDPKHPHKNPGTAEGEAKEREGLRYSLPGAALWLVNSKFSEGSDLKTKAEK